MANVKQMEIDLPGLSEDMRSQIEARVKEFEEKHEPDIVKNGPGWIPRITKNDYFIAITINLIIIIWLTGSFL